MKHSMEISTLHRDNRKIARWLASVGPILASIDWRLVAAFGLPFLLYLRTLAPTIYNLDSAELTTAAATGGLVRATGYPLYLLIGRVWTLLPIGDVGYRMNLFSAFCGALTVALAERSLRRLHVGPWATFGALGLLATAPFFWSLSLIAEVYTLHTALMASLILLLLRWGEDPTPRRLAPIGLVAGLGLAHHASMILLIPGCIWYIATIAPRRALAPRALLPALGALLLGLGLYLYLPLRYAAMPRFNYIGFYNATGTFIPFDLHSPQGLWWVISGQAFVGQMLAYTGAELWREAGHFGVLLWRAFFVIGIGPGLAGMVILLRRNWRIGGMLLLMFVCNAAFFIDYRVGDKVTMFLPTFLIWALWLGVGYQWILEWVRKADKAWLRQGSVWLLGGLMILSVLLAMAWTWRQVDLSGDWSARTRGEEILNQVERNALVFGWWDIVPVIEYLQLVEGRRPDVQAINRFQISYYDMLQLIEQEITRRPVYVDQLPGSVLQIADTEPVGVLYRLRPLE